MLTALPRLKRAAESGQTEVKKPVGRDFAHLSKMNRQFAKGVRRVNPTIGKCAFGSQSRISTMPSRLFVVLRETCGR